LHLNYHHLNDLGQYLLGEMEMEIDGNPQNGDQESDQESETFRKSLQKMKSDSESETQSLESENGVLSEINSEFSQIINSTQIIKQFLDNNHELLMSLSSYNTTTISFPFNGVNTDFNDIIHNFNQSSLQDIKEKRAITFGESLIAFLENQE
jgi:hypothetical protein